MALALAPLIVSAGEQEFPTGEELYAAHCTRCHGTEIHARSNRIVNSMNELRNRVRQCELMAEAAWFEEEVEAVVRYLNDAYYGFSREN